MTRPTPASRSERLVAARATLTELADRIGAAGLAAAARLPGLLAAVDQHAAALRDLLTDGTRVPSPIALAGYVEGLLETAIHLGWQRPGPADVDWSRAHWVLVRKLAVCQLANPSMAA
jgi:hypothetical protein